MTDTATETGVSEIDTRSKAKEKEVLVVHDQGYFIHTTGDTYDGFFEAKKKDRSAKMHGPGVYTTAEGDVYTGIWDSDKLGANEKVTVSYVNGSKYEGSFKDWCYNGHANYIYPDGALLQCEFHENSPVGKLRLIDPNGHTWLGKAEQGFGWVNPVNHYFEMLEHAQFVSKVKKRPKTEPITSSPNKSPDKSPTKTPKAVVETKAGKTPSPTKK